MRETRNGIFNLRNESKPLVARFLKSMRDKYQPHNFQSPSNLLWSGSWRNFYRAVLNQGQISPKVTGTTDMRNTLRVPLTTIIPAGRGVLLRQRKPRSLTESVPWWLTSCNSYHLGYSNWLAFVLKVCQTISLLYFYTIYSTECWFESKWFKITFVPILIYDKQKPRGPLKKGRLSPNSLLETRGKKFIKQNKIIWAPLLKNKYLATILSRKYA